MRINDDNDHSNRADRDVFEPYEGNDLDEADSDDAELRWRVAVEQFAHQARRWVSEHPFAALSVAILTGFAVGRVARR